MPTYEYECMDCRDRFEIFQNITSDQISECPKCHGRLKRLFSPGVGFIFKGSGFYITDYRSSEYKKKEKEEKGSQDKESNEGREKVKDRTPT